MPADPHMRAASIVENDPARIKAQITVLWDEQQAAELKGWHDVARVKAGVIDSLLDRLPRQRTP